MTIRGKAGDDDLSGTVGDDIFNLTRGGNDTASGGDGADIFWMGAGLTASDRIDGGTGDDKVTLNGDYSAGVTFDAQTAVSVEQIYVAGGHSYTLVIDDGTVAAGERLTVDGRGLGAGDVLTFDGSAETNGHLAVHGGAGDDDITGGAKGDRVYLDRGGNDTVHGGAGGDTVYAFGALTADDKLDGGADDDVLVLNGDYSAGLTFNATTVLNVERLELDNGHSYDLTSDDATVAAGRTLTVDGSALTGGSKFVFDGSAELDGAFHFIGGGSNQMTLTGGEGADDFDLRTVSAVASTEVHGGGGNDTFDFLDNFDSSAQIVDGGTGSNTIVLDGDYSAISLVGGVISDIQTITFAAGHSYTGIQLFDDVSNGAGGVTLDASALAGGDDFSVDGSGATARYILKAGAGATGATGSGFNDQFDMGAHFDSDDSIDGGAGFDTVVLDGDYASQLGISGVQLKNVEDLVALSGHSYDIKLVGDGVVANGGNLAVDAGTLAGAYALTFDGSAETDGSFTVYTGAGDDDITGGGKNDQINLNWGGNDTAHGGAGNDAFLMGAAMTTADVIDGGSGTGDGIVLSGDYSARLDITNVTNVEQISVSSGHDYDLRITTDAVTAGLSEMDIDASSLGAMNKLTFDGSAVTSGGFQVTDGAGDDDITTGGGSDAIRLTRGGIDIAHAGGGNDGFRLDANLTAAETLDGGSGIDTLSLAGDYSAGLTFSATTMTNVEQITLLGAFDYKLTLDDANVAAGQTLTIIANTLNAGHKLTFDGSAELDGSFSITGATGDDVLTGGAQNDGFNFTQGGNDTGHGGAGNDTFSFGGAFSAADTVDGGANTDTISLSGNYSAGLTLGASTLTSIENIVLNAGSSYNLTTDNANVASGATLTVLGSAANSLTFNGAAETDGRFHVTGGAGNDTLTGGSLGDTFTGNGGADTYLYTAVSQSASVQYDTIAGFAAGTDKIDLSFTVAGFGNIENHSVDLATFNQDLLAAGASDDQLHSSWAHIVHADGGDLDGHDFLIVDAGGGTQYDAGTDYVIDVTGYTGTLTAGDFI